MNCSIDASKFEQLGHPTTDANVPPTRLSGVAMAAPVLFCPITSTSTAWVGEVALTLIDEPPFRSMLLKLYCAGGMPATRMMFVLDPSVTLGNVGIGNPGTPPVI